MGPFSLYFFFLCKEMSVLGILVPIVSSLWPCLCMTGAIPEARQVERKKELQCLPHILSSSQGSFSALFIKNLNFLCLFCFPYPPCSSLFQPMFELNTKKVKKVKGKKRKEKKSPRKLAIFKLWFFFFLSTLKQSKFSFRCFPTSILVSMKWHLTVSFSSVEILLLVDNISHLSTCLT